MNFLKLERERLGLLQKDLLEPVGVNKGTIIRWESGSSIPSDKLAELAKLGFDISYIVTGTRTVSAKKDTSIEEKRTAQQHLSKKEANFLPPNLFFVPVVDVEASAGHGAMVISEEYTDKSMVFDCQWLSKRNLNKSNLVVITAKGDSMHPTIISGESLVVDTSPLDNFVDGIYVIDLDSHLLVKRLQRQFTGGIKILSDNPAYEAQLVPQESLDQLHIVGRVVWMGKDL